MEFKNRRIFASTACSTLAALAVSPCAAAIPSASGVISACYATKTGALRVVEGGTTCIRGELPLAWNVAGPQGPAGPTGPSGSAALFDVSRYVSRAGDAVLIRTDSNGDELWEAVAQCIPGEVGIAGGTDDRSGPLDLATSFFRLEETQMQVDRSVAPFRYQFRATFVLMNGWRAYRSDATAPYTRITCLTP